MLNPRSPIDDDIAHKAANGQKYDPDKGMLMNGKWSWPGQERGCRCLAKSVIPGFDYPTFNYLTALRFMRAKYLSILSFPQGLGNNCVLFRNRQRLNWTRWVLVLRSH
jgi:hypothetical protein